MMQSKKTVCTFGVIPARLASSRLPRKVLRTLAGRPMLAWVYEAARACPQLDQLVVATDAEEVAALCEASGWPFVMTSPELQSGSDRVFAVAQAYPAEIYVNIQGDEPMLRPEHIGALLAPFAGSGVQVATLKVPCAAADIANPNAVKVVTGLDGRALYFSRCAIPYDRDGVGRAVWKHQGFYAYRAAALNRFHALQPSPLERSERLEQLRFLENGIDIHVAETPHDTIGVDTEDDLRAVEQILLQRGNHRA
jgi:3-deoxy-manno-octulosonate cytidylyltransferase (CMP-KDO synthetase)